MLVTLVGMVMLVKLVTLENARNPMAVTAWPKIVLGITTAPPAPVYPVMVTPLPELV